ncbi:hypothetical protein SHIRM173S_11387 [Streptomyces hirsutus]
MRLTTIRITRDRTAAARIDKKHLTLLPHPDVGALIASAPDWTQHAATHRGERLPSTPLRRRNLCSPPAESSAWDPTARHA